MRKKRPVTDAEKFAEHYRQLYPIVRLGGREWHVVPKAEWALSGEIAEPGQMLMEMLSFEAGDDHKEFPANPPLEDAGRWVGAGIASHEVWGRFEDVPGEMYNYPLALPDELPGFSAMQIVKPAFW